MQRPAPINLPVTSAHSHISMNNFFVPKATNTCHHLAAPIASSTGMAENHEDLQVSQASPVTWDDTFFDDEENIVAVFDFDYPLLEAFEVKLRWACCIASHVWWYSVFILLYLSTVTLPSFRIFLFSSFFIVSVIVNGCSLRKRAQWDVNNRHLCITRDGINYVRDKRKAWFGWPCCDVGKRTQIIPLNKVAKVGIMEPAGNYWCCIRNTLTAVTLSTFSSPTLVLLGLKEPYKFKNFLLEAQRANSYPSMVCAASSQIVPIQDVFSTAPNKEIV